MPDNGLEDWLANNGWLVVILAFALAATGYWGYQQQQALNNFQSELDSRYAHAFQELVEDVDKLEEELGVLAIGEAPDKLSVNLSRAWRTAYSAHEDISELPLQSDELDNLKRLLMRTVNYSRRLDQKVVDGKLEKSEREVLNKIRKQLKNTDTQLEEINDKMAQGHFNWYDKRRVTLDESQGEYAGAIMEGFKDLNSNIELDSIDQNIDAVGMEGFFDKKDILAGLAGMDKKEINEKEAVQAAKKFLNKPERYNFETIHQKEVEVGGETVETNLPTYSVKGEEADDQARRVYLDISKKGGGVVWMLKQRPIGKEKLSKSEAINQGKKFLEKRGYKNLDHNISEKFNRLLIASFAPRDEEAMINAQEIRLEVALDRGEIVGFNGIDYFLNQKDRSKQELNPKLTVEEAREKLNGDVKVTSEPELVIEKINGREKLCYQFVGKLDGEGERYEILINAKTGAEEKLENIEGDLYQD